MRDPDLVQRAERAAAALEQAWVHWRIRHGLGPGPLPPVSSYVGYSVTEPWGQPRVVLGVEAHEAERLAAILEGDDYVGPVHDDVTARIELHHPAKGGYVPPQPTGEQLDPAEAAGSIVRPEPSGDPYAEAAPADDGDGRYNGYHPADGSYSLGRPDAAQQTSEPPSPELVPAPLAPADNGERRTWYAPPAPAHARPEPELQPSGAATDALTAEQPILPLALRRAAAMADTPAELPQDAAAYLRELASRSASRPPMAHAFPAASSASDDGAPDAAETDEAGQPGIVALRPRSAPPSGLLDDPQHDPALHPAARQWAGPAVPVPDRGPHADEHHAQAAETRGRTKLLPVSRLNKSRRPAAGAPEARPWAAGDAKQPASDTAV